MTYRTHAARHATKVFVCLGYLVSAACSDLATDPDATPAALVLSDEIVVVTEDQNVAIGLTVVDRRGNPIPSIPDWAAVQWATTNPNIVAVDNGSTLVAAAPGEVTVRASVAGLVESATVRVNPKSVRLDIGAVTLSQPDSPNGFLASGIPTTMRVFLTADTINFLQPGVVATLSSGGAVLGTLNLEREGISIPRQLDTGYPGAAWTATIPPEYVQPGLQFYVEADPDGSFVHSSGSNDRYPSGGTFNVAVDLPAKLIRVESAYLTQSIQRFDGTVPLVEGRDALLRVFVTADEANEFRPTVHATFYHGETLVHEVEMLSETLSIPQVVQEGLLSHSWNAMIPGSILRENARMVIEVDPGGTIPLKAGSVTRVPQVGTQGLVVRPVPPLWLRMIPITQTSVGTTGNISEANISTYIDALRGKLPLEQINVDLRAPYYSGTTASTDQGWTNLLFEIRALRVTDNSARYYYGLLRHPGGNQIGGIGFIGLPAALGFDHAVLGPETFAHELGHNFSLRHAPCGGPSDADPSFPYAGGGIGHFGYDFVNGTVKLPTQHKDLMTYCGPEWISDYSYVKALNFREANDWTETGPDAVQDALLVWGGVNEGEMVLEPSFRLDMRPSVPAGSRGAYEVRGLNGSGATIFSYRFDPEEIDHVDARSFAFAIPNSIARADELTEIVLTGPEGVVRRQSSGAAPSPAVRSARPGIVRGEASWNVAESPVALVRDAQTGEVISFARGGRIALPGRIVDVSTSDGVTSTRSRIDLR